MYFAAAARLVVDLIPVLGAASLLMAVMVPTLMGGRPDAVGRYLGYVENSGDAIAQGMFFIAVALALGAITDSRRGVPAHARATGHER